MEHILDVNGYDHILFVVALAALYVIDDWKKVLILVTAFTIGHSITLALATLDIINVNRDLIEFLIPVTIFITAVSNLFINETSYFNRKKVSINYVFAAFFGLIHGMGFSNYLKSLLGQDRSILTQLLAFNIGLEVGQIIIVLIFMLGGVLFINIFGVGRRDWKMIISSAVAGIAITMIIDSSYL